VRKRAPVTDSEIHRRCSVCAGWLPLSVFRPIGREPGRLAARCRSCEAEYDRGRRVQKRLAARERYRARIAVERGGEWADVRDPRGRRPMDSVAPSRAST
jgi:hypothetical protein